MIRHSFRRMAGVVILYILLYMPMAWGQDAFVIDDQTSGLTPIPSQLSVWVDSQGNTLFPDLLAVAHFMPFVADMEFPVGSPVWGRISIENKSKVFRNCLLHIGPNTHDEVWLQSDGKWICKKSGKLYPVSEIEVNEGLPWNCKVLLDLAPGAKSQVYIRIRHTMGQSPRFDLKLEDMQQWSLKARERNLLQGIFHGISLIMLLYNLLLFGFSRDKAYLYYSLYILVAGLYFFHWQGYSRIFLFPEFPKWDSHLALLSALIPPTYLIFMRRMLHTKLMIKREDPWIRWTIRAGLTIFLASLPIYAVSQNSPLTFGILNLLILAQMIVIFFFLRALYQTGEKLAYFFILGTALLWGITCLGLALYISLGLNRAVEMIQVGVAMELLLFSVGLGYRMRQNEQKRLEAQQDLIAQLQENEDIQRQAHEALEFRVRERTVELEAEKEKVLKASRAKAEFLSIMSHEIRTPMNAVIGMTNIILGENPREDQLENLKVLKFSGENLMALINDILDFTKIEAGNIDFEHINFCLPNLLKSIQEGNYYQAAEKGIDLRLNIDELIPHWLTGDPTRLTQILNNLVNNAIKFTQRGYVCIQVSLIGQTPQGHNLLFEVTDTGIGIPMDKQEHIFHTFTQAQSSTTREFGGTGLGLAITRKLLELQNSGIAVNSIPGKGSTFFFELEYALGKAPDPTQSIREHVAADYDALAGLSALIVEDNRINAMITRKYFESWGLSVSHAENGKIAVEMVQNKHFDFVIMDLQMPVMDGYQATRAIRALGNPQLSSIPIIALTASALLEIQVDITTAGMDGWAIKPFKPDELYQKIHQILIRKRILT